jgi:hypothetical protein
VTGEPRQGKTRQTRRGKETHSPGDPTNLVPQKTYASHFFCTSPRILRRCGESELVWPGGRRPCDRVLASPWAWKGDGFLGRGASCGSIGGFQRVSRISICILFFFILWFYRPWPPPPPSQTSCFFFTCLPMQILGWEHFLVMRKPASHGQGYGRVCMYAGCSALVYDCFSPFFLGGSLK